MAVTRKILAEIRGNISTTSGTITIKEQIAWTDLAERLGEIFGPSLSTGIVATELDPALAIYRAQSAEFESFTNNVTSTVPGASAEDGITDGGGFPVFEYAHLTIQYSSLEQQSPSDQNEADQDGDGDPVPFLTHSWSIGGDFITLDNAKMFWSSGTSAEATGIAANKIIPTIEHSINWKRVLNPPFDEIRNCLGKVNEKKMTFATGTIYPECLLFNGAEMSRDIMSDGTRAWDVTYRFSERRVDAGLIPKALSSTLGSYDGVGPQGGMSDEERDAAGVIVTAMESSSPTELSTTPGQYGGWNHFYNKNPIVVGTGASAVTTHPAGMYRLHTSLPAQYPFLFQQSLAVYKKYDLLKLFEQA